ncbi:MAG: hypothetical protein JXO22_06745 [Phycisphaerae bacterium]|nr:hypothetical protein [Phycisphaerae bacterium]
MNGETDNAKQTGGRTRCVIILSVAAVVLLVSAALFTWYTYARITTMPPKTLADYQTWLCALPVPSHDDVSDEIRAAMVVLLAPQPFDAKPPEGVESDRSHDHSELEFDDVLSGPWDPENRPHLRAAAAFLLSDEVTTACETLRTCRGRPFVPPDNNQRTNSSITLPRGGLRALILVLTARSRALHAGSDDALAAWEQLKVVLWLGRPRALVGRDNVPLELIAEHAVLAELGHMCQERHLDTAIVADIRQTILGLPPIDEIFAKRIQAMHEERLMLIDCFYTDNGSGDGWAVLETTNGLRTDWGLTPNTLWSIASGLYDGRAEALEAAWRTFETEKEYVSLSGSECARRIARHVYEPEFGALCHPLLYRYWQGPVALHWRVRLLDQLARRRGTLAMLALNEYHRDRGCYPAELSELVPAYMDELPIDPFSDEPLRYRREEVAYTLYSIGHNGPNDDGWEHRYNSAKGDIVFSLPREDIYRSQW